MKISFSQIKWNNRYIDRWIDRPISGILAGSGAV